MCAFVCEEERESVCVCMCVRVRGERERERERNERNGRKKNVVMYKVGHLLSGRVSD